MAYRDCRTVENVWEAIKSLRVRGAPAIGIAAAYGVVIGVQRAAAVLGEVADYLRTSRPTAVNLWVLERMDRSGSGRRRRNCVLDEARAIDEEDRQMCRAIGRAGAALVGEGSGRA